MKLGKLISDGFQEALGRLNRVPLPINVAYAIKGITSAVRSEYIKYEEARLQSLKKYAKLDEHDDIVVDSELNIVFKTIEDQTNYMHDLEQIFKIDINLPKATIQLSDMADTKISAQDLDILEDILDVKIS